MRTYWGIITYEIKFKPSSYDNLYCCLYDKSSFSNDHEWVSVEGNIATVGITDFAQSQLGDIVFLDITTEGETLNAGDEFGSIEAVKTVAPALMPIGGKIIEVNPDLESAPESVNKDPYGAGWLIKVEMTNPSEVDSLLDATAYESICK